MIRTDLHHLTAFEFAQISAGPGAAAVRVLRGDVRKILLRVDLALQIEQNGDCLGLSREEGEVIDSTEDTHQITGKKILSSYWSAVSMVDSLVAVISHGDLLCIKQGTRRRALATLADVLNRWVLPDNDVHEDLRAGRGAECQEETRRSFLRHGFNQ